MQCRYFLQHRAIRSTRLGEVNVARYPQGTPSERKPLEADARESYVKSVAQLGDGSEKESKWMHMTLKLRDKRRDIWQ